MPTTKTKRSTRSTTRSFKVTGNNLLKKVKALIHEGNIRTISIIDKNGKTLLVFPVTIGVVGAALAPILAAVGAIAAFVSECTIKVEKDASKK